MATKDPDSGTQPSEKSPGWRGKSQPARPAARHDWQQPAGGPAQQVVAARRFWRRFKIALATTAGTLLLGLFIFIVFWRDLPTPLLAAVVTDYPAPLPPNAWAKEDLDRFEARGEASSRFGVDRSNYELTRIPNLWESKDRALDDLRQSLERAKPGGPGKNVILLYISAHGVVDGQGRPCLILGSAGSAPPERAWLPVSDLVKQLGEIKPGVKKVLFLDAGRMHSNWSLGLLYNSFAEGLEQVQSDARNAKNVYIFNSTSPGEIGWASPEIEASPFAYAVWRGLRGYDKADDDGNGRVSLKELHAYVQAEVGQWAGVRRWDAQTPMIVPDPVKLDDFDLVLADSLPEPPDQPGLALRSVRRPRGLLPADDDQPAAGTPPSASRDRDDAQERLARLWDTHEQLCPWSGSDARRMLPRDRCLLWERFQSGLLRYEQLASAGAAYRDEAAALLVRLEEWKEDLTSTIQKPSIAAHSLPLARRRSAPIDTPDELRQAEQLRVGRALADAAQKLPRTGLDYVTLAGTAWDAVRRKPDAQVLRLALELVRRPPEEFGAEVVEIRFLRLLQPDGEFPQLIWRDPATWIQPALDCRDLAEHAAAPADERVHYWARHLVDQADPVRRQAEDNLFVGRADNLASAGKHWKTADKRYQSAIQVAEQVAHAYDVRDRAFAELPYLGPWITRRLSSADLAPEKLKRLDAEAERLLKVVESTHELARQLDAALDGYLQSGGTDTERLGESAALALSAKAIQADLDRLHRLLQESRNANEPWEIAALLSTPLVGGGDERHLLHARMLNPGPPALKTTSRTPYLARILQWRQHPAVALLDPKALQRKLAGNDPASATDETPVVRLGRTESPSSDEEQQHSALDEQARSLAAQGAQVRQWLIELDDQITQWLEAPGGGGGIAAIRADLSLADRRTRASAAAWVAKTLASKSDPLGRDATLRLAEFDLGQLMFWHAERALEDFWGPDDPEADRDAYFEPVAKSYRDAAQSLSPLDRGAWGEQTKRLADRTNAVGRVLSAVVNDQDPPVVTDGAFDLAFKIDSAEHLPRGRGAVYVVEPHATTAAGIPVEPNDKFGRFEIQLEAEPAVAKEGSLPVQFRGDVEEAATQSWKLVAWYRGHRRITSFFPLSSKPRYELVYRRPKYDQPKVTVIGDSKQRATVVFVLDCSSSMKDPAPGGGTRMEAAKSALLEMLDALAAADHYDVGLWLYGHRVGVKADSSHSVNNAWDPVPAELRPGDDVQNVLDIQPLGKQGVQRFVPVLNKANRWGVTPLYLAMEQAIQKLTNGPATGPRLLVVITDGDHDQWKEPLFPRTAGHVTEAMATDRRGHAASPIQLHLVDCSRNGSAKLTSLARHAQVQGEYHRVVNLAELHEKLRKALGLHEYEIVEIDAERPERSGRLPLRRSYAIRGLMDDPRHFDARLIDVERANPSPFRVEGGESLVIEVIEQRGSVRLAHQPYTRRGEFVDSREGLANPRAEDALDADFNPATFDVLAHTPTRSDDGSYEFPISIHNGNRERFSPRPKEAWVEITPLGASEPVFRYPIFDLKFEPDRPVPVLSCVAPDWPSGANEAEIRLWFRPVDQAPSETFIVAEVADDKWRQGLAPAGAPPVEFKIKLSPYPDGAGQGSQIVVVERHHRDADAPAGAFDAPWLKVDMLLAPDEIRREYFPAARWARHTFIYERISAGNVKLKNYQMGLTTKDDLERGAVALDAEPLQVAIEP